MPCCLCVTKDAREKDQIKIKDLQPLMVAFFESWPRLTQKKKRSRPQAHHRSTHQPDVAKAHHPQHPNASTPHLWITLIAFKKWVGHLRHFKITWCAKGGWKKHRLVSFLDQAAFSAVWSFFLQLEVDVGSDSVHVFWVIFFQFSGRGLEVQTMRGRERDWKNTSIFTYIFMCIYI